MLAQPKPSSPAPPLRLLCHLFLKGACAESSNLIWQPSHACDPIDFQYYTMGAKGQQGGLWIAIQKRARKPDPVRREHSILLACSARKAFLGVDSSFLTLHLLTPVTFLHSPAVSITFGQTERFLFPSLLAHEPLTEAAAAAELQHADGGSGWPEQQLHLTTQRHTGAHQRRDQQGVVTLFQPVPILQVKGCQLIASISVSLKIITSIQANYCMKSLLD